MADSTITIGILTMGDPSGAAAVTAALAGVTSASSSASAETIKLSTGMKTSAAEARAVASAAKEAAKAKEAFAAAVEKAAIAAEKESNAQAKAAAKAKEAFAAAVEKAAIAAEKESNAQAKAAANTASVTANTQAKTAAISTNNKLTAAQQQQGTATSNAAMGFLFLSQAIEDAQYGFSAILNNIPLIIMSMGQAMGLSAAAATGLAGGISILAVGLNVLFKSTDLGTVSIAKFAEKLSEAADESRSAAEASAKAAHAAYLVDDANKRLKSSIEEVTEKYRVEKEAIEEVTKAKLADIDAAEALGDAQSKLEMAKLKQSHDAGGISDVDFEVEKAGIRERGEQRKFDNGQARRDAEKEGKEADAAQEEKIANELAQKAADLAKARIGMLTKEELKAEKDKRQAAADARNAAATEESRAKESERTMWGTTQELLASAFAPGARDKINEEAEIKAEYQKQQIANAQKAAFAAEKAQKEADAAIAADKAARDATGFTDSDTARGEIARLQKESRDAKEKARQDRVAAETIGKKSAAEKTVFDVTRQVTDVEGSTDVMTAQAKTRKKEDDASDKEAKARDKASKGMRDLSGDAAKSGMTDSGVAALRKAAEKVQEDNPKLDAEVLALLQLMTRRLVHGNTKDETMRKEIDNLTEQIKNMRDGN